MKGWICSYRKIWKNKFFKGNGMRVAVWHWLLHHTAYSETEHTAGGATLTIPRGEVCFSQQQICDDTGATRKQVRDVIDFLVSTRMAKKIGANERANEGAKGGSQKGPTKEQGINNTSDEGTAAAPPPSGEVVEVSLVSRAVWSAKPWLESKGVKNPAAVIGKWLKAETGNTSLQVLAAIEAAQKAGTDDPIPYITQVLSKGSAPPPRPREPANTADKYRRMMARMK